MPQRFLRPGITTSQRFNAVTWQAQCFWMRLVTLVDDFGRYDAEPRLLRSHAFPFGDPAGHDIPLKAIDNMCEQLSAACLAIFYTAGGKKFLQLVRWQEKPRANASKYPAYDSTCEQMFADVSKCSAPSSSSSSSPLHPRHSLNGSKEPSRPTDEDWISDLEKSEAYTGINVKNEYAKMSEWCKVRKQTPTRRRFVNWLNRAEKPMGTGKQPSYQSRQAKINALNQRKAELMRMEQTEQVGRELCKVDLQLHKL